MGALSSKPFQRDDAIPGQGMALMHDSKTLGLKGRQLDRLYQEFCKYEDKETYTADMASLLGDGGGPVMDLLFQQFDKTKSGELLFHDFVLTTWNFLSVSDGDLLANFMFQLFDVENANVMEIFEIKYMINLAWKFKLNREVTRALKKLDKNEDGLVTVAEFVLLYRHFPSILKPVLDLRNKLRKAIAFTRFWKEIADHRKKEFYIRPIFDILDRNDARERRLSALEHVALHSLVPTGYADKWRDVTRKKEDTAEKKECIDLPDEVLSEEDRRKREERLALVAQTELLKKQGKLVRRQGPHLDFTSDEALLNDSDDRMDELILKLSQQHVRKKASKPSLKKHATVTPVKF